MSDVAKTLGSESLLDNGDFLSKKTIRLSEKPANLLSKEGFALYVGKTVTAVVSMAKAGKLPAFYMADPSKPGGHAELWISRSEWDKYAEQLVEDAPSEWHGWKDRISAKKPGRGHRSVSGVAA
ncbi:MULTISPECIES: Cox family DNA-binding protein [Yersinia]|uniref:Cox family DNA-binding protein n=1 Tax=Yersinia TaxID=629 RepID=UPI000EAC97BD|nr:MULTISPECIES: Cox family DNA-binding protein [Yersinia]MCW6623682.1 regulatory phage cox family protein [Yersinia ruckeri]